MLGALGRARVGERVEGSDSAGPRPCRRQAARGPPGVGLAPPPLPRGLGPLRGPGHSTRASGAEAWPALRTQVLLPRPRAASGRAPEALGRSQAWREAAGAVRQAQPPHPESPERAKSRCRAAGALPPTGSLESYAGAEWR